MRYFKYNCDELPLLLAPNHLCNCEDNLQCAISSIIVMNYLCC